MDKLKSTARRLDVFFRVLQIAFTVAAVSALVGLVLIGACFLFRLDPDMIGNGYNVVELGILELELAEGAAPDKHQILMIVAVELAMGIAATLLGRACMGCVRRLLAPMKEGSPFHDTAAAGLKRLALLSLILGVVLNCAEFVNYLLTDYCYGLTELLLSDGILRISVQHKLDLTCLVISGVLLLLSYIFRYGQTLQQLSDETL